MYRPETLQKYFPGAKFIFSFPGGRNWWQPATRTWNFFKAFMRPCERRLRNYKNFQQVIRQIQARIEMHFKRKVEISPSSPVTVKSAKSSSNERSCFASKIMLSWLAESNAVCWQNQFWRKNFLPTPDSISSSSRQNLEGTYPRRAIYWPTFLSVLSRRERTLRTRL